MKFIYLLVSLIACFVWLGNALVMRNSEINLAVAQRALSSCLMRQLSCHNPISVIRRWIMIHYNLLQAPHGTYINCDMRWNNLDEWSKQWSIWFVRDLAWLSTLNGGNVARLAWRFSNFIQRNWWLFSKQEMRVTQPIYNELKTKTFFFYDFCFSCDKRKLNFLYLWHFIVAFVSSSGDAFASQDSLRKFPFVSCEFRWRGNGEQPSLISFRFPFASRRQTTFISC